mgnify:CR=1 FL=1
MEKPVGPEGEKILVRAAAAYDPSQGWKGEVRDLFVAGGRLSEPFSDADRTIDVQGRPVLAGGIEPHGLFAFPGLTFLDGCSGLKGREEIGETYARMGYVHVHQPLATLVTAGLVRHRLKRLSFVDASYSVALDLRDLGGLVRAARGAEIGRLARELLQLSGALGIFMACPFLRHRQRHYMQKNLTTKKVLAVLSDLGDEGLYPVRILGSAGLLDELAERLEKFHVCGLGRVLETHDGLEKCTAFLDRGGRADLDLATGQEDVVISCLPEPARGPLSLDMGLPFPVSFSVRKISPGEKIFENVLSLLCRAERRWRLSLSVSGLTGGLGRARPELLARFLCERNRTCGGQGPGCWDAEGLYALARLTRLEPARSLGLEDIGHLRVGARASLAVYDLRPGMGEDRLAEALVDCWYLLKDGVVIREEGTFTGGRAPCRVVSPPGRMDGVDLRGTDLFENATLRLENLGVFGIGE